MHRIANSDRHGWLRVCTYQVFMQGRSLRRGLSQLTRGKRFTKSTSRRGLVTDATASCRQDQSFAEGPEEAPKWRSFQPWEADC